MSGSARILVVDDEVDMCTYLCDVLQRAGYQVECAYDGVIALSRFEREPFDLVLADIRMPKMDGLEMLRRIKMRDPHAVVIVMTAYSFIDNAIEAVRYGAYDYLPKPFSSRDELLDAIERGLAQRPSAGGEAAGRD